MKEALRILVIEDNEANLELMVYLLRAMGYEPLSAEDGLSGLALARDLVPDLVLCDINMPGMNGFEVATELRADVRTRQIPIIAITAFAMVGDRERILASGFDMYLSKPIQPETFVDQIRELVKKPTVVEGG